MCGIAGVIQLGSTPRQDNEKSLSRALDAMQHRGPDHRRQIELQGMHIGHVRLSIIDTQAAAHQPMTDVSGRYTLVFNGEIFNFQTLRQGLQQQEFRTSSDTEVLLYHLIENGINKIHELNGFFSFCFIDQKEQRIHIARDRMGEKPLYYGIFHDHFYFASELQPLLAFDIPKELDKHATTHFLQHGYYPPDRSAIQGIQKLERGHVITISEGRCNVKAWSLPETTYDINNPAEAFRETFDAAIERRLISDVPLCTLLSGGIDSSLVTSIAHQHQHTIPAFTLRFIGSEYLDESSIAARFTRERNIEHHILSIDQSQLNKNFGAMLQVMDEPFGDSSALALYSLTQAIGRPYKVALSGDGGDELLGGYRKHMAWMRANEASALNSILKILPLKLIPSKGEGRENKWSDRLRKLKKYAALLNTPSEQRYAALRAFVADTEMQSLQHIFPAFTSHVDVKTLNAFLLADQRWVLQGDMLTKTDRCGMWSSMEIRSPFMDPEVIGFCNALSEEWKISHGRQKKLLFESFKNDLPEWLWQAPKRGFEIPLQANIDGWINAFSPNEQDKSEDFIALLHRMRDPKTSLYLRYNLLMLLHWMERNDISV
ncbi:MAG: hypothetical protein RLZZ262_1197 [Bacteroidota bacterium]|jgi:asparagine synthase (glutamine-hydrolysing)